MATLELTNEQLSLVQQALDFYSRVGIGQMWAILALLVTLSIFNGSAQTVVHFADPLNEIATAFMSLMLTICLTALSFEKIK